MEKKDSASTGSARTAGEVAQKPKSGWLNVAIDYGPLVVFLLSFYLFQPDGDDSVGTLVAVGDQAGLMKNGQLPRARGALLADAVGTVAGAGLGTSTVTAYVESATGVAAGGRTGLTAVVVALLFLLSLVFWPLVSMIGEGYNTGSGVTLYPVVAPALILVGALMIRGVRRIEWDDPTEALPAFLTLMVMPLALSITDGIAFGFISYVVLKLATRRLAEAHWLVRLFAVLFLLRYAFLV